MNDCDFVYAHLRLTENSTVELISPGLQLLIDVFGSDLEDTSTRSIKEEPLLWSEVPVLLSVADLANIEEGCALAEEEPIDQ